MYITLISACQKRALKRTRAILDSYALRHGENTWMTPITLAGLQELRNLLRRSATRQTSVACFVVHHKTQMRLLWIVGNQKSFDNLGISPIGIRLRKESRYFPDWARTCAILAAAAGVTHDLGKFAKAFQKKLRNPKPIADPVRHEWLSFLLIKRLITADNIKSAWEKAWKELPQQQFKEMDIFNIPLTRATDVLLFLIATHHRLFGTEKDKNYATTKNHVQDKLEINYLPIPITAPSAENWRRIEKYLSKIHRLPQNPDPLYWRGIATIARMALILADHVVSAIETKMDQNVLAYANTLRKTKKLNQSLDWHLENVAHEAGRMIGRFLNLTPPGVSEETFEELLRPTLNVRFMWQNYAATALQTSREINPLPYLVLNMAATGSGKTRMNTRALAVLAKDRRLRIATALNLRTLTLQTADAYTEQLHIGSDELACVIGDRVTHQLHDWQKDLNPSPPDPILIDDDENYPQPEIELLLDNEEKFFKYSTAPEWLQKFFKSQPNLTAIIGAPILVSTIDFLIAAGEPQKQGHYALAMLRLMTSDLILDEIDSYEPKSLIAVLRLVMMAGFWGRNVIAASATLALPIARALWRAYAKGNEMRSKVMGAAANFITAIIDDLSAPVIANLPDLTRFEDTYLAQVKKILSQLSSSKMLRVPYLEKIPLSETTSPELNARNLTVWYQAINNSIMKLHADHAWEDPFTNQRLSLGLIRVANINSAIPLARELANIQSVRVVCYHSQLFTLQRYYIENTLDRLLKRHNGNQHILHEPVIRAALEKTTANNVIFIVVATPVEEIGRDHDFDWAIIEPSSVQSIVQTAGRVNRHRLISVTKPNVILLQFNRKTILHGLTSKAFYWPGFEGENPYPTHDLNELLDWKRMEQIDARLRFEDHQFAQLDNQSIAQAIENPLNTFLAADKTHWMMDHTYLDNPLRANNETETWLAEDDETFSKLEYLSDGKIQPINKQIKILPRCANDWLVLNIFELQEFAREIGLPTQEALKISIKAYNHLPTFDRSFGFY